MNEQDIREALARQLFRSSYAAENSVAGGSITNYPSREVFDELSDDCKNFWLDEAQDFLSTEPIKTLLEIGELAHWNMERLKSMAKTIGDSQ